MKSKPTVLKKLYLGFIVVVALLSAIIALTYINFLRVDATNDSKVHTYKVLAAIDGMNNGLLSTTRSARSYALTGNPRYYRAFVAADLAYDRYYTLTRTLTRDNPAQQRKLQRLKQQHERWHEDFVRPLLQLQGTVPDAIRDNSVSRARDGHMGVVARLTVTREYLFDLQRITLASLENAEKTLLSQREAAATRQQRIFELTLVGAAALLILLAAVFTRLLANNMWQVSAANERLHSEIDERERIQQEVTTRQQFLNALLDNMNAGVIACDANGTVTLFNRATREFHGVPLDGSVPNGRTLADDIYLPDGKTPLKAEDTRH
jgi:methyl-accepting chemotaxis protein